MAVSQSSTFQSGRIASIDQYRGAAIAGMLVVNHLGEFNCMPEQFRHHETYMTFADVIAPLFIFVVGMSFRISLQRRIDRHGPRRAYMSAVKRCLALICIGIVLYDPAPQEWRNWWDALVDIGCGGILALPFIARGIAVRAIAGAAYWALYQAIFIAGYGSWTTTQSICGGPLGPLSWAPILLFGTIAYDIVADGKGKSIIYSCLAWGLALSAAGILLHFPFGGFKACWLFSQRSMQIPYPLLATGLCFLMYVPFYYLNDVMKVSVPTLAVMGMNALVVYIVQSALFDMYGPSFIVPENSSWPLALVDFAFLYGCCYAVAWKLKKDNIVIKL